MKTFFQLLTLSLLATQAFAQVRTFNAVIRTEDNKATEEQVALEDLISADGFDGKHFKIVKGKSEDAISFSDLDEGLLLRAATTYYHLTRARNYFIDVVNSEFVKQSKKMTIRLEHTNQFSELGHFAHDNLDPQSNNALTVPGGKGLTSRGVKPWDNEIWFRPRKDIHLRDLSSGSSMQEVQVLMRGFRNQIHMQTLQRFMSQAVSALVANGSGAETFGLSSAMRLVGSSVIIEFGYQFIDPITKAISRKWYWLDTALVPEIIYHEYSHAALSDKLVLSHSTAIIEGMADFFAGQIAGSPKLAAHIKKYNTFSGKNAKRKQLYKSQFELGEYANSDFVFGLLWEIKNLLGEAKGSAFMYELRNNLTTNSTIRGELVEGILKTCDQVCDQPFVDKMAILKKLNLRGI